jgi:hypothetical protein
MSSYDKALVRMVEGERKTRKVIHWKGAIQPWENLVVHNHGSGFTTKTFKQSRELFKYLHNNTKE